MSILSDHYKEGKRFIPPFVKKLGPLHEIKWVDYILPELLWLGLLNDRYGLAKGADLGLSLARSAFKENSGPQKKLFALISSYATLTEEQKNEVIKALSLSNELEQLKEAFVPLAAFYPECPLNFLFEGALPNLENSKEMLERFKVCLLTLFDRWEKAATLVQANAIYIAFVSGLLKVQKGLALANFQAIADFPDTEESKRVAGSVRCAINVFFAEDFYNKSSPWPIYFWNRGLKLEPCYYQGVLDDNE